MERDEFGELQGQSSINELLEEPVGNTPVQLALPILIQVKPGHFQRLS
ncbi:hypothetical protein [Arthrobacter sp. fls2-241-R2A-200]|nr:hypothetical protein [Arthrobacter sp. fls2-241-R2A-200]